MSPSLGVRPPTIRAEHSSIRSTPPALPPHTPVGSLRKSQVDVACLLDLPFLDTWTRIVVPLELVIAWRALYASATAATTAPGGETFGRMSSFKHTVARIGSRPATRKAGR